MITFNEFLNTDMEHSEAIFDFYLNFLGELSSKNFPFDEQLKLKGAGIKFLNTIDRISYIQPEQKDKYLKLLDEFQETLKHYRQRVSIFNIIRLLIPNKVILFRLQNSFQDIYSITLELINEATNKTTYYDDLKVNDFYKPNNSNKQRIKDLINEAIGFLRDDLALTEKSKKNIIEYLEKALKELEKERVNWTRFLGRIKETVIVLGALGSLIGGASTLYNVQEKLEQTTEIIQKTSVNINFNILNETFNIENMQHIGSINNLLALPEKLEIQDPEKVNPGEKKND